MSGGWTMLHLPLSVTRAQSHDKHLSRSHAHTNMHTYCGGCIVLFVTVCCWVLLDMISWMPLRTTLRAFSSPEGPADTTIRQVIQRKDLQQLGDMPVCRACPSVVSCSVSEGPCDPNHALELPICCNFLDERCNSLQAQCRKKFDGFCGIVRAQ